jgi:hypothetical protein
MLANALWVPWLENMKVQQLQWLSKRLPLHLVVLEIPAETQVSAAGPQIVMMQMNRSAYSRLV